MCERRFLWGVATSAFQLEGSPHADWAAWDPKLHAHPEVTHHYHLYKKDLKLLKEIGVNAYRFSLEWSRIQPVENEWDTDALRHYQDMVDLLQEEQIEPILTLHHFTHPKWFIEAYPWHRDPSIKKFLDFVRRVVEELKGVRYWITFNEPNVFLLGGFLDGSMPPGIRDRAAYAQAFENVLRAHGAAFDILHTLLPHAQVGLAHNMVIVSPYRKWNPLDKFLARTAHRYYNHAFLDSLMNGRLRIRLPISYKIEREVPVKGKLDFVGINYYTRIHLRFNPFRPMGLELRHEDRNGYGLTDTGWEIHPSGLEQILKDVSRYKLPILITENGIATRDRQKKDQFIKSHIDILERCLKRGMDIRGYFYWSLLDNYEWLKGLEARFGLYSVNYDTLERKATPLAGFYTYLIQKRSNFD